MAFFEAVLTCLHKYAVFSGRASRPEYWSFVLFLVLAAIGLSVLDSWLFRGSFSLSVNGIVLETSGPLGSLFSLVVLVPWLAAGWRRMHDSGRSGIHLLYPLIVMVGVRMFIGVMTGFAPLLGGEVFEQVRALGGLALIAALFVLAASPLIVMWWLTRPSQPGDNRYGRDPNHPTSKRVT